MLLTDKVFSNAAIGNHTDIFKEIHTDSKNIAIFQRDVNHLNTELSELANYNLNFEYSGKTNDILNSLEQYLSKYFKNHSRLADDIKQLLIEFEHITGGTAFRVWLKTISANMCTRFHADYNTLRMLCTYIGKGTLWLPDQAINIKAYLKGKSNTDIVVNEDLIQQVHTGDVIILKGAKYPKAKPILHRSPDIKTKNALRLLLRIDILN